MDDDVPTQRTIELTDRDAARLMMRSVADSFKSSFSGWFLVGTAASTSLLVINLDKLLPIIGSWAVKHVLLGLLISLVFGTSTKLACAFLSAVLHAKLPDELKIRFVAGPELNVRRVEEDFRRMITSFNPLVFKSVAGGHLDIAWGYMALISVLVAGQVGACGVAIGVVARALAA